MSSRCIVNVATGGYVKGQDRIFERFAAECEVTLALWDINAVGAPKHEDVPYAFKAYALKRAGSAYLADTLLWCDACIVPGARPLTDLWEKIERDGVWLANNGFTNYEWTADSAYPDLFADEIELCGRVAARAQMPSIATQEQLRAVNKTIPHVVATAFGISLKHPNGRAFLDEYYRLASETKAFCGPWTNCVAHPGKVHMPDPRCEPCGLSDVRGHRHDQTAAAVIAWRLGIELTNCPEWFSYRGGENETTCLVADGFYA
jgi:hypothetical protein